MERLFKEADKLKFTDDQSAEVLNSKETISFRHKTTGRLPRQERGHVMSQASFTSSRGDGTKPRGGVQRQRHCMNDPISKAAIK